MAAGSEDRGSENSRRRDGLARILIHKKKAFSTIRNQVLDLNSLMYHKNVDIYAPRIMTNLKIDSFENREGNIRKGIKWVKTGTVFGALSSL